MPGLPSENALLVLSLKNFLCPITHCIMVDPVFASDGHTYERKAIEDWLRLGHKSSPLTQEQITSVLIPNRHLKSLISNLHENNRKHEELSSLSGAPRVEASRAAPQEESSAGAAPLADVVRAESSR